MSGKDIYEDNKRLRAENENLREVEETLRLKREEKAGALADLFMVCAQQFLEGTAALAIKNIAEAPGRSPTTLVTFKRLSEEAQNQRPTAGPEA